MSDTPIHHPRSRVFNTEAIILRRADFGEADRLLTVLSPERGKLCMIAKGARKIGSRKGGHVELFTRVNMLVARGKNLDILSQVETLAAHREIREDLARSAIAHYICELAEQFSQEDAEERALYDLLGLILAALCVTHDPALAARYFELRLLTLAGFRPELDRCVKTGDAIELDKAVAGQSWMFSPMEGGMLSPALVTYARDAIPINAPTLLALRALQSQPAGRALVLSFTEYLHVQTERALRHYLNHILERAPQSRKFLRELS